MKKQITVTALHQYPIKGCKRISTDRLHLGPMGPGFDRRWMLIDATGRFLSQRQFPQMALIETRLEEGKLIVGIPKVPEISVPYIRGQKREVTVWDDTCLAEDQGDTIAEALSQFLEKDCRLVFMPDSTRRQVKQKYAISPDNVFGFADGYPLLLISEASLEDLNRRLEHPITMDRFRPNIVVSGCEPFEEDTWKWFKIGDVLFKGAKLCSRCGVINIEQSKGEKGTEPFQTLATYRKQETKVMFGLNLIHAEQGMLELGQTIDVLEIADAAQCDAQSLT